MSGGLMLFKISIVLLFNVIKSIRDYKNFDAIDDIKIGGDSKIVIS